MHSFVVLPPFEILPPWNVRRTSGSPSQSKLPICGEAVGVVLKDPSRISVIFIVLAADLERLHYLKMFPRSSPALVSIS
jgi:hypothetical protein